MLAELVNLDSRRGLVQNALVAFDDLVGSRNSCGFPIVASEESAEPFPTANGPFHSVRLFAGREQQQIALPLVISFVVKMTAPGAATVIGVTAVGEDEASPIRQWVRFSGDG